MKPQTAKGKTMPANPKKKPARSTAVAIRQPSAPRSLLEVCAAAARDPKVDVAKMQTLLAMAKEQKDEAARVDFDHAMLAAQIEIGQNRVVKGAWNPHTKSRYVKLEALAAVVDPIARRHGFTVSWGMSDSPTEDHYRILADVTRVSIVNGERISFSKRWLADIGTDTVGAKGGGTKSAAQGSGSSISYGRRYLLGLIFNVVPVGEDNDGAGAVSDRITAKQAKQLEAALADGGPNEAKFLQAFQVAALPDLGAAQFQPALDRISEYKSKVAAKAKAGEAA